MEYQTADVEAVNEVAVPTPAAPAGTMQFQEPWADPQGEHLIGYRIGNGRTLIVEYGLYGNDPTMHLVSDDDARLVRDRHRRKQLDLARLGALEEHDADLFERVLFQDLWRNVTLLPLSLEDQGLVVWPGETEAMEACKQ